MKKKTYYEKYSEQKKIQNQYKQNKEIVIEHSNYLKNLLSFFSSITNNIFKIAFYLVVIGLCSLGATYLINNVLHIKIF